ncbi:MAG TPA: ImmA/IrrE family metallo-endopeptidase [Candidatus Deferrimicrobiaceae bacterium]|jgi:hypothetical protein
MKVPVVDPLSRKAISEKGHRLLSKYQPECLTAATPLEVDWVFEKIVHDHGFIFDLQQLPAGMEGLTHPKDKMVIIPPDIYDQMCNGDGRARFTMMHEASHVILHAAKVREVMVNRGMEGLKRRGEFPAYLDPEWQANELAATLLMPEHAVREIMSNRFGCPSMIADRLNVSYQAADIRVRNLGIG